MIRNVYYRLKRKNGNQSFKPVILVTGCSSGIGWALAKLLYHQTQYRVVATARSQSLEKLKAEFKDDSRFWVRSLDVTCTKSREQLLQEINEHWGGIHILINNAGISYRSVVEHMTEKDEVLQMATNYLGPMGLIRSVLPFMRSQGRGKIINISSVSGMLATPTMASYSASKYALEGASEALWYECRPLGIDISLIQPGFVRSESFRNVYRTPHSKCKSFQEAYADYYSHLSSFIEKMMQMSLSDPQRIAKLVLKTIQSQKPPLWIPATLDAWVFYYIRRLLPRRLLLPFLFRCLPGSSSWGCHYSRKRR